MPGFEFRSWWHPFASLDGLILAENGGGVKGRGVKIYYYPLQPNFSSQLPVLYAGTQVG